MPDGNLRPQVDASPQRARADHLQADPGASRPQAWSRRLVLASVLVLAVALAGCTTSTDEDLASEATVAFDYDGMREQGPQQTEHAVAYDPDDRPTMQMYEGAGTDRPDAYTVHDLMVDWSEQTDTPVSITHDEDLGYQLDAVDGTPSGASSTFWGLWIDGERETAGLGTIVVSEDATYEWRLLEGDVASDESGPSQPGDATDGSPDGSEDGSEDPSGDGGDADAEPPGSDSSDPASTQSATMVVDYDGFRGEEPQRTEHEVTYDPTTRPTMHRYEGSDVGRPDAFILHDLVSDWANQTDTSHIAREHEDLGFRLESIAGVTAHSTQGGSWSWQLTIDGEEETASINSIEVEEGATYEWRFTRTQR